MSTNKNEPEIELIFNKEFNKIKLTAQEQAAILNNFSMGAIDHEEYLNQMERGGVLVDDAEEISKRMSNNGE